MLLMEYSLCNKLINTQTNSTTVMNIVVNYLLRSCEKLATTYFRVVNILPDNFMYPGVSSSSPIKMMRNSIYIYLPGKKENSPMDGSGPYRRWFTPWTSSQASLAQPSRPERVWHLNPRTVSVFLLHDLGQGGDKNTPRSLRVPFLRDCFRQNCAVPNIGYQNEWTAIWRRNRSSNLTGNGNMAA